MPGIKQPSPERVFFPQKHRLCTTLGHVTQTDERDEPPPRRQSPHPAGLREAITGEAQLKRDNFRALRLLLGWEIAAAAAAGAGKTGETPRGAHPRTPGMTLHPKQDRTAILESGWQHLCSAGQGAVGPPIPDLCAVVGEGSRAEPRGPSFPPQCHCIYFSHGDSLLRSRRQLSNAGRLKEASKTFFFGGSGD